MLPNYAYWGGLEAYQRGVSDSEKCLGVKMGKNVRIFCRASTHYLINAYMEKGNI